jgi:hypothetical protein
MGVDLSNRREESLELGDAFDRMIGFHRRFARADRAGQDLEIHLVGAGLGADVALPIAQQIDHGLLVPRSEPLVFLSLSMNCNLFSRVQETRAPWKGGAFQWVQAPSGNRSSRKQPEQSFPIMQHNRVDTG